MQGPTDALIDAIRDSRTLATIIVATLALALYDIAINLGREVKFIWRSRWTWPKILYITARYYPVFSLLIYWLSWGFIHHSQTRCRILTSLMVLPANPNVSLLPVDFILYLRLAALYEHNTRVTVPILAVVIIGAIVQAATAIRIISYRNETFRLAPPDAPLLGCWLDISTATILPPLIVSSVATIVVSNTLFIALLYKVIREAHARARVGLAPGLCKLPPLLKACIRDGAVYFAIIEAAVGVAELQLFRNEPGALGISCIPFVIVSASIAGSRLVLELREDAAATNGTVDFPLSHLMFDTTTEGSDIHSQGRTTPAVGKEV